MSGLTKSIENNDGSSTTDMICKNEPLPVQYPTSPDSTSHSPSELTQHMHLHTDPPPQPPVPQLDHVPYRPSLTPPFPPLPPHARCRPPSHLVACTPSGRLRASTLTAKLRVEFMCCTYLATCTQLASQVSTQRSEKFICFTGSGGHGRAGSEMGVV